MKTGFVTRYCYGLWAILLVQLCLPCLSWLTLMLFFLHSSVIDSSFVLSVDLVSSDKNIIVAAWLCDLISMFFDSWYVTDLFVIPYCAGSSFVTWYCPVLSMVYKARWSLESDISPLVKYRLRFRDLFLLVVATLVALQKHIQGYSPIGFFFFLGMHVVKPGSFRLRIFLACWSCTGSDRFWPEMEIVELRSVWLCLLGHLYMVGHGYDMRLQICSIIVIVARDNCVRCTIVTIDGCSGDWSSPYFFVLIAAWCSVFGACEEVTFFHALLPLHMLI